MTEGVTDYSSPEWWVGIALLVGAFPLILLTLNQRFRNLPYVAFVFLIGVTGSVLCYMAWGYIEIGFY